MDKKVYYGEYTLLHWIELILKHNIMLPKYQRGFVWPKENLASLVESFKERSFIPPIIIGVFNEGGQTKNIILDGQQRLTCLLLSYLKLYPKFEFFKKPIENLYQDSEESSMEDEPLPQESIVWKFDILLNKDNPPKLLLTRDEIREANQTDLDKYENLPAESCLSQEELENTYMGFSYIVPVGANEIDQQTFYSKVFRDINIQGVELQNQESRRALYYLKPTLTPLFEPDCVNSTLITQNGKQMHYDFVRSLAFLSQYEKCNGSGSIAKGCRKQANLEKYYADYIDNVIRAKHDETFGVFATVIGEENITVRLQKLNVHIQGMHLNKIFDSIIDADMYMFGLIYITVLKGLTLESADYDTIKRGIESSIQIFKNDASHKRSPNALGHLRNRISKSIEIYNNHAKPVL